MSSMTLPDGLYELLLTDALAAALSDQPHHTEPAGAASQELLFDALSRQLSNALDSFEHDPAGARGQLELVAGLLARLRRLLRKTQQDPEAAPAFVQPLQLLRQVGRADTKLAAPETGLLQPWLFTAGKSSPALLHEIRRELAACDGIDVLMSFITVSGVRKILDVLRKTTGSAGGTPTPIRVLTTTYTGATDAEALDQLARLPGCQVRVSLDGRRSRLHAKAWIFRRHSGFGAAYIGSANLSGAAMTGGMEWTVKLTQRGQTTLFDCATAHFETLWADREFEHYDPENASHRVALRQALKREEGEDRGPLNSFFDLTPKPFQQELLEQLEAERTLGRHRLLLVAATGTGKTVVAAFDYRLLCESLRGVQPRLLFVAHREEILRQALHTYRAVLRDPEFGELLAGGVEPQRHDHLFVTIDSLSTRGLVARCGADFWHSVVIDECHRLAADRFDSFVSAIRPSELLGLTATPERSDGQPIAHYFDMRPDGSPAVELRLWHALDLQLLAPFEYYGCDDDTDFSAVPWDQAGERQALGVLVAGNEARAKLVVREWQRLTGGARRGRALAFCVSVAHALFMTDAFNRAGLPAACVTGATSSDERRAAPGRLRSGELSVLVTVDLYNEGIDLPFVDTLLLLRPTQSPVVFQQQIGRGLRLHPGKDSCLVLDFVGQHRANFRFDRLLGSLTGQTRRALRDSVDQGFAQLPPGCHIHLQPRTREQALAGLRAMADGNWRQLRRELQAYAALHGPANVSLLRFLHDQALTLDDVYRPQGLSGWAALKRSAGLIVSEPTPEEDYFSGRLHSLRHVDDSERLAALRMLALGQLPSVGLAQMAAYQVDGSRDRLGSGSAFAQRLHGNAAAQAELGELAVALEAQVRVLQALPGLEDTPLRLHARYGIREILTAVGWFSPTSRPPFQAGVLALAKRKVELLFVTLDKRSGYHERIAYRDYAIDSERFHWQSQNSAAPDTPGGRRYLECGHNGWSFQLFVRETPADAYAACGPVLLSSAEGGRPMNIVWRLAHPLPARLFSRFSVLRAA